MIGGVIMDSLLNVSRRGLVKWGLAAAGLPMLTRAFRSTALAQDASAEGGKKGAIGGRAEEELYTGKGLQGGGQLEIRLTQSIYTSDPDALEVAQRMKPFDLESWIVEWTRVAEKNEELAEKFASEAIRSQPMNTISRRPDFTGKRAGRSRWTNLA